MNKPAFPVTTAPGAKLEDPGMSRYDYLLFHMTACLANSLMQRMPKSLTDKYPGKTDHEIICLEAIAITDCLFEHSQDS